MATWTYCRFCGRFKPCEPQRNALLCRQCGDYYLSGERDSAGVIESAREFGEDRQVGVQPNPLDASHAEG